MSMIDKRRREKSVVDYWRSMVDVVLGILLVVLLAMSLLILGLMDRPLLEETGEVYTVEPTPVYVYPSGGGEATPTPSPSPTPTPTATHDGGGGGGDWTEPTPTPSPTFFPAETFGPIFDDKTRCAVMIRIRDLETDRVLTVEGVSFELFDRENQQLAYDVYYPQRIEYDEFETTKQGSFFLPDKLALGVYSLHNIKPPEDYDLMPAMDFTVEEPRDWDEPLIVEAYLSPATSTITLDVKDADTGEGILGGLYLVTADKDVVTSDGTVRYPAGELIDRLSCSPEGTAKTSPLFLGTFRIEQKEIPFGYAKADMGKPVTIHKIPSNTVVSVTMQKTTVLLTVRDELTLARVPNVPFVLTGGSQAVDLQADGNGEIRLSSLKKNTDYSFVRKNADNGYLPSADAFTFHVDQDGLIEGEALYEMPIVIRKIRCSFEAATAVLSRPITGCDMGLFRADGTVVAQWTSKDEPQLMEGLEPGAYVLTVDGKEMRLTVRDTADQQLFRFRVWQAEEAVVVAGSALALLASLIAVAVILNRRRKRASSGAKATEE